MRLGEPGGSTERAGSFGQYRPIEILLVRDSAIMPNAIKGAWRENAFAAGPVISIVRSGLVSLADLRAWRHKNRPRARIYLAKRYHVSGHDQLLPTRAATGDRRALDRAYWIQRNEQTATFAAARLGVQNFTKNTYNQQRASSVCYGRGER
jgi:hypothetical protein